MKSVSLLERPTNPADRLDRKLRGDFPGFVPAHPVGDREKPQLGIGDEPVFVGLADAARV